jgi:ribosomal protein S18 acetylase RimI-like enzyme
MTDAERAWALMDRLDEAIVERVEPTAHGELLVDTSLPQVYDRNFLRVRRPGTAAAPELAAEAEESQARHPAIRHRRVNVRGADIAERLEPGFVELGWAPERFVLMVKRGQPDRPGDAPVREVEAQALREAWALAGQSFGGSEALIRQMVEHHAGIGRALPTRHFAVEDEGRIVSYCELYSSEGVGQVENVVTLPEYRRRGYARALVTHAADASAAEGNDVTFLVANADDWPYRLYEQLSFEIADRYARFLKAG